MKRVILFTVAFLTLLSVTTAQENYTPMLKVGKKWVSYEIRGDFREVRWTFFVFGDTIVNDMACYKMRVTMTDWNTDELLMQYKPDVILQEKDGQVWTLTAEGVRKSLLFDYSLAPGDVVPHDTDFSVSDIDLLEVDGRQYRRLVLAGNVLISGSELCSEQYWVEGIGSMFGPLWSVKDGGIGSIGNLQACYEGDVCIFHGNDFLPHRPMLEEGKMWTYESNASSPENACQYTYYLQGDTIIGEQKYWKLFKDGKEKYQCALREEDRQVYCLDKGSQEEQLLYSFKAQAGEILSVMGSTAEVNYTSVYSREGLNYGSLTVAADWNGNMLHFFWLDGIGSLEELLHPTTEYWGENRLLACTVGNQVVYALPGYETSVKASNVKSRQEQGAIYDLQGRRVQGTPQRGLYIREGRKVIK